MARPWLTRRRDLALGTAGVLGLNLWLRAAPPARALARTVRIADMTWMEVRDAVAAGVTTAIVPSGGLEQNGPQMIIGKHDHLVSWSADRIARSLGNALVTPVVSYVPEGTYDPPSGHLRFPGTLGVPPPVFGGVLEGIARSLKLAGFRTICLLADHGASVPVQQDVAARLTAEWQGQGVRVVGVDAYYGERVETCYLHDHGETDDTAGPHASIADTSELMAVDPDGVDLSRLPADLRQLPALGGTGDPRRSTVERGDALMTAKVQAALVQIRAARGAA